MNFLALLSALTADRVGREVLAFGLGLVLMAVLFLFSVVILVAAWLLPVATWGGA